MKYIILGLLALVLGCPPAFAQPSPPPVRITTGACLTGGPVGPTGTIAATSVTKNDTTTAYAFGSTDACKVITRNNSSAMSDTLPQAGTSGMGAGLGFAVMNYGTAAETITPAGGSTIGGKANLVLTMGESCDITVNAAGTNYDVSECKAFPSGVTAGTYGDSTHVGQVVVDAAGIVTSASNVVIATSGVSLAGNNTWTGPQSNGETTLTISGTTYTPTGATNNYYILLTSACASAACTFGNSSGGWASDGTIEVCQPASGGPAAFGTYGSDYVYAGTTSAITYSTGANACDYWSYHKNHAGKVVLTIGSQNPT